MLRELSRRPRFLVAAISLVVLPLAWWFAWMAPAGARVASARENATMEQTERAQLAGQLAVLVKEAAQLKKAGPHVGRFTEALPTTPDAPGLVLQVYDLAKRVGVNLESITDDSVTPAKGGSYSTVPVAIAVSGGHDAILSFVSGLYSINRLLTIQQLELSGAGPLNATGSGTFSASITATAYTTGPPAPVATNAG